VGAEEKGRADAEAVHAWFTSRATEPPYPDAPAADCLQVANGGTINGKPVVVGQDGKPILGQGGNSENPFISRNQNAIAPDKRGQGPTLISDEAIASGKARYGERPKYPNSTIENSHAEVVFMQNAHDAGLIKAGDTMTLSVTGRRVCDNCQMHLPLMAEKTGLRFMTVVDRKRGVVYYWHQGMKKLSVLK
jgi:hypothetical protein